LIETLQQLAEDISDSASQRAAITFLGRSVAIWGQPISQVPGDAKPQGGLPGFETFIYDRLVPAMFLVPSQPGFNAKDGQMTTVSRDFSPMSALYISCDRSCTRLQIYCKLFAKRGAQKRTTTFSLSSYHRKTGHRMWLWILPRNFKIWMERLSANTLQTWCDLPVHLHDLASPTIIPSRPIAFAYVTSALIYCSCTCHYHSTLTCM
jgi:hypothetical protein